MPGDFYCGVCVLDFYGICNLSRLGVSFRGELLTFTA
jgi:hypothetical protein